jgi:hydroxymethylpyrimidine/phosphomethylpyrimidine kinase
MFAVKNILTIAGLDPSSGAGVTKDLDIYFSLGLHGLSVPTSIVPQGPTGVRDVYPVPYNQFLVMLETIGQDVRIDGVKIGVVPDEAYMEAISNFLHKYGQGPVVVDPILTAKNGRELMSRRGLASLIRLIFPRATIVTPNIGEASAIMSRKVKTLRDMEECAKSIALTGPKAVVIKGGHLKGDPIDILFDGSEITVWKKRRIERDIHGTGCIFSSLLTALLVHGYSIREAFYAAERWMEELIKESYPLGEEGYFYASSAVLNSRQAAKWRVLCAMKEAGERLRDLNPVECIPEVQMNIGYAVEGALGTEDVAAFPGRIGHLDGRIYFKGEVLFGASSHVARLILNFTKRFPHVRACANIRYDRSFLKKARSKGLRVVYFDRRQEPEKIKKLEGRSLDFLMEEVLRNEEDPPDLIYDEGDVGKEPIIRLFARNPLELIKKMEMIAR